jgi:hypothetical protein
MPPNVKTAMRQPNAPTQCVNARRLKQGLWEATDHGKARAETVEDFCSCFL